MAMSLPCSGGEMSSRQGSVVCLTVIPQSVPNVNGSPAADISVCILQTSSSDRVGEESLRLGKAYPISSGGLGRCVAQLQRRLFPQRHCCFFFLERKTQWKPQAGEPVKSSGEVGCGGGERLRREKCENRDWLT